MLINMIPYRQIGNTEVRRVSRYTDKLALSQIRIEKDRQVSR